LNQLADRVALAMEANRVRPVDVPRRGGPSRPTLHRILTDAAYKADSLTLDRLADALGVSRRWLQTGAGDMAGNTISMATGSGKTQAFLANALATLGPLSTEPGFGKRIQAAMEEAGVPSLTAASMLLKIPKRRLEKYIEESTEVAPNDLMAIALGLQKDARWLALGKHPASNRMETMEAFPAPQFLDRELLSRAIIVALQFYPGKPAKFIANAIADAYDVASKPGRGDKIEELVKALLL
jgi:hypothetical protein